jgi:Protein of unknown function (DUF3107)
MGFGSQLQESVMEIRIGIVQSMKELDVELPDDADRDKVMKEVEEALAGDGDKVLWLVDRKGRRVGVPASRIAYVELGTPASERVVGFGAA